MSDPRPQPSHAAPGAGRRPSWRLAGALFAVGLFLLYQNALRTGFLNDDHVFLEQVRNQGFPGALLQADPLSNYVRPLSRQLCFSLLYPLSHLGALPHHLANFALFLLALALLADLLRAFVPAPAALVGVAYFALLHGQRVLLTWVSCAQDLLALVGALGAVALFRRGRRAWATAAYAAAILSKESALPLPALLALWSRWEERLAWPQAWKRAAGPAAAALAWLVLVGSRYLRHPALEPDLRAGLSEALAAYAHMAQSFLFLEQPQRALDNLFHHPPNGMALVALLPLALWLPARPPRAEAGRTRSALRFAAAWCVLAAVPLTLVAATWSAYYYTLAAVGAALAAAALGARADRGAWLVLLPALLWLHAGASGARAFAVAEKPWVWTSRLTPFYFERGAGYVKRFSDDMRALAPAPPRESRFFFATLPYFAGFQMGNGPLLRTLYRDPTLRSYFYSQFSESTAADGPCDFFYWDGERIRRLYSSARGRFTQVAGDLLLLDRPAGARHALLRALRVGEDAREAYYWLGWALLAGGDRPATEEAWRRMGARDSAAAYWSALEAADRALARGDSATAHRALLAAIPYHVGRPEAHRQLGALLFGREPKYALLELKVAVTLDPRDAESRRRLAIGLARLGMNEQARVHLDRLLAEQPRLGADPEVRAALAQARAAPGGGDVMEYPLEDRAGLRKQE